MVQMTFAGTLDSSATSKRSMARPSEPLAPTDERSASGAKTSSCATLEARLALLRRHGTFTLAYSTLQAGLEYFGSDAGFIAYKMVGTTAYVLADPVSAPEHREALLRRFVRLKPDVCFCQVSRATAEVLAGLGFRVNEMGTETRIDLESYKRKSLRRALSRANTEGYVIREATAEAVGVGEIADVSERWRQTRTYKRSEVCFLTRPIVCEDEVDVRKFFAFDRRGNLVALSFYDPIYRDGEVVGYSTSFKRRVPEAEPFICSAILRSAMNAFRAEGREVLFLGLSPMADIEDKEFRHSFLLSCGFRYAFRSSLFNRFVYPLQGHASHKRDYQGVTEQTYFCFNKRLALPRMLKLLRACNMI
jgi:phosphatidylglycerol lysyltransferase